MTYFDDILNVYAYLFSKSAKNSEESQRLAREAVKLASSQQKLSDELDVLISDVDELLARAYALAQEQNIETSGLSAGEEEREEEAYPRREPVSVDIRIPLPGDFDFEQDFRRLVKEAHDAGFTDAHPEDMLSAEEMNRAREMSDRLDEQFAKATRLKGKDVAVLTIAVAARVTCYFLVRKLAGLKKGTGEAVPQPQLIQTPADTAPAKTGASAGLPIDAAQGVDISGMLNSMAGHGNAVAMGQAAASQLTGNFAAPGRILDHVTILDQNAPFDIQDTDMFAKDDIIAYHKFLGWIVGVVNILTDTITTYGMKSYSVTRPMPGLGKPCVDREVSTLFGVVSPVVQNVGYYKDSVVAAAVQEGLTLGFGRAEPGQVRTLFGRALELENKTNAMAEETKGLLGGFKAEWAACIGGIAVTTLINTIVAAVHAMVYEESDGDLDTYSVRTNKIILYSGAIATVVNSLPAIASRNVADLDYSGILTTCMSLFQSESFWIEAKAQFLTSAYRQELEKELQALDKYFQYTV